MEQFACRFVDSILNLRCGKPMFRDNIGDLFDYPYCEECQVKEAFCPDCRKIIPEENITRLDDGRHN